MYIEGLGCYPVGINEGARETLLLSSSLLWCGVGRIKEAGDWVPIGLTDWSF